ncbi:MAG: type II toxin-antitoxin system prevent-host-death family antitoxin [Actinophytocola sp.]|nr:type II toxin-antitoxin system prevent-host-death family antitoxin [Actinophytocola sp.]
MDNAANQYNVHEAKTHLSRIIERVQRGEEIVISRAGEPAAKLVPFPRKVHRRGRGSLKGSLILADDWDSPEVNNAIARDFES